MDNVRFLSHIWDGRCGPHGYQDGPRFERWWCHAAIAMTSDRHSALVVANVLLWAVVICPPVLPGVDGRPCLRLPASGLVVRVHEERPVRAGRRYDEGTLMAYPTIKLRDRQIILVSGFSRPTDTAGRRRPPVITDETMLKAVATANGEAVAFGYVKGKWFPAA